jgi:hypothetical protein
METRRRGDKETLRISDCGIRKAEVTKKRMNKLLSNQVSWSEFELTDSVKITPLAISQMFTAR